MSDWGNMPPKPHFPLNPICTMSPKPHVRMSKPKGAYVFCAMSPKPHVPMSPKPRVPMSNPKGVYVFCTMSPKPHVPMSNPKGLGLLGLLQTFPKGWGAFLLRGGWSFHGTRGWQVRASPAHPVRASLFGWMWSFAKWLPQGLFDGLLIKDLSKNPVMFLDKTHSRQFDVFLQYSFASLSRSKNHQILKFRLGSDLGVKQIRYNKNANF